MTISHKNKDIFLKTNKTAGTSIEIAPSQYCGNNDVITPLTDEDEIIRRALGYRGPQNTAVSEGSSECFYNHIPASTVKSWIGDEIWNSYFKFWFERNAWDRVISLYYWRCKKEPRPPLSKFLSSDIPSVLKRKGFNIYTIDGSVVVDKVFLYEELEESLKSIQ